LLLEEAVALEMRLHLYLAVLAEAVDKTTLHQGRKVLQGRGMLAELDFKPVVLAPVVEVVVQVLLV
jgi:hypothetical protein